MFARYSVVIFILSEAVCLCSPILADDPQLQVVSSSTFTIPHTSQFEVQSQKGLSYRIFVAEPQNTRSDDPPSLLIVLDANSCFAAATQMYRLQQRGSQLKPAVIVGIGYPTDQPIDMVRRTYDLTTPAPAEMLPPRPGGQPWPRNGGADQFLKFIEQELKPWIRDKYTTNPDTEAIFGHSFGGLFVLHALLTHPESFHTYIAASPSVWWNNYAVRYEAIHFSNNLNCDCHARLLVTLGELELSSDEGPAAVLSPTAASQDFGTTKDFIERFQKLKMKSLELEFVLFENENHGSVIPLALNRGIRFALKSR